MEEALIKSGTQSSVKLEGKTKGPPTVTVHAYADSPSVAAKDAMDLWFDTHAEVGKRFSKIEVIKE